MGAKLSALCSFYYQKETHVYYLIYLFIFWCKSPHHGRLFSGGIAWSRWAMGNNLTILYNIDSYKHQQSPVKDSLILQRKQLLREGNDLCTWPKSWVELGIWILNAQQVFFLLQHMFLNRYFGVLYITNANKCILKCK